MIVSYGSRITRGTARRNFSATSRTQDAVIRNIEVIGQAVKDFGTEDLTAAYGDTPWDQVAGMRNILAHQYLGVDIRLTWDVVEKDLSELKRKMKQIAQDLGIDLPEP